VRSLLPSAWCETSNAPAINQGPIANQLHVPAPETPRLPEKESKAQSVFQYNLSA